MACLKHIQRKVVNRHNEVRKALENGKKAYIGVKIRPQPPYYYITR